MVDATQYKDRGPGSAPPGYFMPPPGMSHDDFISWFKGAAGGVPTMQGTDPEQAWAQYQQGQFTVNTKVEGQSGAGTTPWYLPFLDPAVAGIMTAPIGGVGAIGAAIGSAGLDWMGGGGDPSPSKDNAPTPTQQPTGVAPPAYSTENLRNYTNNFLIPFVNHVNSMVQGDISQWGSAIQKMTGSLNLPQNIANDLKPTANESALYQLLVPLLAQQQITQNYVDAANQNIGLSAAIGARNETQGAAIQNLAAQGLITINPALSGSLGSLGTAGTTGGVPALMNNMPSVNAIQNAISTVPQTPTP